MTEFVGFNRMLANGLRRIVQRNDGEFHGSWWQIANALQLEIGGIVMEEQVTDMRQHLMAVTLDYLVHGTELVTFKSINGDWHLVDRRHVYYVE